MFTPTQLTITNITQAYPAVVTTSTNHNLTTGQIVRTIVPVNYGMVELNKKLLSITILTANTFSLQYTQVPPTKNVDSRAFTAFTTPSNPGMTAQILPVGSGPTPLTGPIPLVRNYACDDFLGDSTANISTTPIPF
jgi:hypothetical protein